MSIYSAQLLEGQTTHGTVHLSELNPGDVVTLITENSHYKITITERFKFVPRIKYATGVHVESTNPSVRCFDSPVLNKVTNSITTPSKACINGWQTSYVQGILINDTPLDAHS
ncbi:hypothetical protein I8H84_00105 [Candidatus Saccharibacteria bacterium]|nr:hypothetical protein [Candidatus Saccharibacteria bacterium]MBH1972359.1 hypothetical protein [Candidatus Saccharibacteria bacterium]MBH1990299.1 hypothetical protein [Candidatus Saccharibacteria bacterium]